MGSMSSGRAGAGGLSWSSDTDLTDTQASSTKLQYQFHRLAPVQRKQCGEKKVNKANALFQKLF